MPAIIDTNTVHSAKGSQAWTWTVRLFEDGPAEFGRRCHARPTVESIFNSVKARYGNALRCTNKIAQRREIGLRAICHNTNTVNKPEIAAGLGLYGSCCHSGQGTPAARGPQCTPAARNAPPPHCRPPPACAAASAFRSRAADACP